MIAVFFWPTLGFIFGLIFGFALCLFVLTKGELQGRAVSEAYHEGVQDGLDLADMDEEERDH